MHILAECIGVFHTKRGNACLGFILNSPNAVEQANELPKGICEVEVNRVRRDRTVNQNAMLWKLIGDISMAEYGKRTAETDMTIYRHILKNAGAKVEVLIIRTNALPEFFRRTGDLFRAYVIGRQFNTKDGEQMTQIYAYYGTSTMDTTEMGRVIDETLAYASEMGLDVEYWRSQFNDTGTDSTETSEVR